VWPILCIHIFSIGQFLRIGFGANKVGVAFCIICFYCIEKLSIDNDDDKEDGKLRKVESMAKDELRVDTIRKIEKENRLVKICTYHMVMLYLKNITPLIEVGKDSFSVK